ncbi:DNA adenine methylase [Limimonas halophila]|uniref:site-specific DNA-methyltransferase (adenine-specific) n=1 Tax=Limimonas halophila TaxID=1082479 RepID=A0A1G7QSF5_9PROT|nr:DNA adenine methylase [Limimonas halophila]SDG01456.1 DNA adenine methylase [Limimonas halophila]
MTKAKTYSPLRYPGGKAFLTDFFEAVLQENGLFDGTYVEPFAGGVGAGINLLLRERISRLVINDASYAVYAFWRCVFDQTANLCERIHSSDCTLATRDYAKRVVESAQSVRMDELAWAFFFLNRVNRSGLISAGPIGGRSQEGRYKIDARFNRESLCDKIELIAQYRSRVEICNNDAETLLRCRHWGNAALLYLDPPYVKPKGKLYHNGFIGSQHSRLAHYLTSKEAPYYWILTYDNSDEIRDLYKEAEGLDLDISYSLLNRSRGKEVMFWSRGLRMDDSRCVLRNEASRRVVGAM